MNCICDYCGKETTKSEGHYNRAKKLGAKLYCNQKCFGLDRRDNKTTEQRKKEKVEYDKKYRKEYTEEIKKEKAIKFKDWYYNKGGMEIEREKRKKKMPKHIEYCRQPKYKAYKKQYDEKHRAKKMYGEFSEAAIILLDLEKELDRKSPEMLSIKFQNGTVNKITKRKNHGKATKSTKTDSH